LQEAHFPNKRTESSRISPFKTKLPFQVADDKKPKDTRLNSQIKSLLEIKNNSKIKSNHCIFSGSSHSVLRSESGEDRISTLSSVESEFGSENVPQGFDICNELDSPTEFSSNKMPRLPLAFNNEKPHINSINPRVLGAVVKAGADTSRKDASDGMELEVLTKLPQSPKKSSFFTLKPIQLSSHLSGSLLDVSPPLYRELSLSNPLMASSEPLLAIKKVVSHSVKDPEEDLSEEEKWMNESKDAKHWVNGREYECLVIDCRYPYEYKGGHIKGALNLNSPRSVEFLFKDSQRHMFNRSFLRKLKSMSPAELNHENLEFLVEANPNPPRDCYPLIVIHCEYSSKRGPRMWEHLRNIDRTMNTEFYPKLTYPELYLLRSGYKSFVIDQGDLCEPKRGYLSMFDEAHKLELSGCSKQETAEWNSISKQRDQKRKKHLSQSRLDF